MSTSIKVTEQDAERIYQRILSFCGNGDYRAAVTKAGIRNFHTCWDLYREMGAIESDILDDEGEWVDHLLRSSPSGEFIKNLRFMAMQKTLQTAIPTSVVLSSGNTHISQLRIPPAIYDLLFTLLAVHYCIKNTPVMNAEMRVGGMPPNANIYNFIRKYFFFYINTLAIVDPELWQEIKNIYVKAIRDENLGRLFDTVYILDINSDLSQVKSRFAKRDTLIYVTDVVTNIDNQTFAGSESYITLFRGLQTIVNLAIELREKLEMTIIDHVKKVKEEKKGDPKMATTLSLLSDILKRSAVVNSDGVFTIDIDPATDSFKYVPQKNVPSGERPVISRVEMVGTNLKNGKAVELPISNDPDIQGIAYIINPQQAQHFKAIDDDAVLFDFINDAVSVHQTNSMAESVHAGNTATVTAPHVNTSEHTGPNEGDIREIPGSDMEYVYHIIDGIGFWQPRRGQRRQVTPPDQQEPEANNGTDEIQVVIQEVPEPTNPAATIMQGHFEQRPEGMRWVPDI